MTSIQGVNWKDSNLLAENKNTLRLTGSESFDFALDAAKKLIETSKMAEADVTQKTIDFMSGENDNIVDLMVAQSKSNILLQYSMQVRNGLLSAYKEILNITI